MTPVRLALVALLLTCALPTFAQTAFGAGFNGPIHTSKHFSFGVPEHVDVWNLAAQPTNKDATQRFEDAVNNLKADGGSHLTTLDADSDLSMVITPAGLDGACFTIRSIVVARDRKDSDATHFVRTSTCQPSSRYRLRSAQQTDLSGH
jgi:hypothetical protein